MLQALYWSKKKGCLAARTYITLSWWQMAGEGGEYKWSQFHTQDIPGLAASVAGAERVSTKSLKVSKETLLGETSLGFVPTAA